MPVRAEIIARLLEMDGPAAVDYWMTVDRVANGILVAYKNYCVLEQLDRAGYPHIVVLGRKRSEKIAEVPPGDRIRVLYRWLVEHDVETAGMQVMNDGSPVIGFADPEQAALFTLRWA